MNAFKLAAERNLSTKTMSVTRDSKRDQLIVVEEVSQPTGPETYRSSIFYFIYDDVPTSDVNELLALSKSGAILAFLGLATVETSQEKPDIDAPASGAVAEPVAEDEAKPKKKAKKAVSKKPAKKPAPLKVAKTPEPEPEPEVDLDGLMDDDTEDEPEPDTTIMYSRTDRSHATNLKPILIKKLGDDWKKDAAKASKVRELIKEISGSIPVTDVAGNVLPTFGPAVEELLEEKLRA